MKKAIVTANSLFIFLFVFTQQSLAQTTNPPLPTQIDITPPAQTVPVGTISINSVINFIITLLIVVGVIISLIFLILGGIKWVLSGGDKAGVESARNHIVGAIIGLVIIVLSFVILSFIFQILGVGGSPLNFHLPSLTGK